MLLDGAFTIQGPRADPAAFVARWHRISHADRLHPSGSGYRKNMESGIADVKSPLPFRLPLIGGVSTLPAARW